MQSSSYPMAIMLKNAECQSLLRKDDVENQKSENSKYSSENWTRFMQNLYKKQYQNIRKKISDLIALFW